MTTCFFGHGQTVGVARTSETLAIGVATAAPRYQLVLDSGPGICACGCAAVGRCELWGASATACCASFTSDGACVKFLVGIHFYDLG